MGKKKSKMQVTGLSSLIWPGGVSYYRKIVLKLTLNLDPIFFPLQ